MEYLNYLIVIIFAVFLVLEGKESIKRFKAHKEMVKEVLERKEGIIVCKDYKWIIFGYVVCALFMAAYSIIYVKNEQLSFAAIFWVFDLFCIIFIMDAIVTRTIVFFESGFLFGTQTIKYRSVLKIEDKKHFLKGYRVKLTQDMEAYVTKKARVILEEKLVEYKNRKKKR